VKTIIYTGGAGPESITAGVAGTFFKGEPRDIDDDAVADQLLLKDFFISDPPTDRTALIAARSVPLPDPAATATLAPKLKTKAAAQSEEV
jgi:hypothetical protein